MSGPQPLTELLERFKHGVTLDEFKTLYPKFLGLKEKREFDSEYDFIDDRVEWFRSVGAFEHPALEGDQWLKSQKQWVVIRGYYPIWQYANTGHNGIEHKWFVGSNAIRTDVLVLDEISARVWEMVISNATFYDEALAWFIILRANVKSGNSRHVRNVWEQYSNVLRRPKDFVVPALEVLAEHSVAPILQDLVNGSQIIAKTTPLYYGGCYHLLTTPSWTFEINRNHRIWNWSYVV